MAVTNYAPRPLAVPREYAGYQFHAILRREGCAAEECFRFAALTIQHWMCERIRNSGGEVPQEAECPLPEAYAGVGMEALRSCRLDFAEIASIPEKGVWAIMVREPDPETPGRAYATHAGLRIISGAEVEFGVRVMVADRDASLPELECAYRPQFVRLLFAAEGMALREAMPLQYKRYVEVSGRGDLKALRSLAASRENQLPLVVFTHAVPGPGALPSPLEWQIGSPRFGIPQDFLAQIGDQPPTPPPAPAVRPFLPFDAAELAQHIYGFAQAYVVAPELFEELRTKLNRPALREGDCLVLEPKPFGGGVKIHEYREGLSSGWYRDEMAATQRDVERASKRKRFSFGEVLFLEDALALRRDLELEEMRAAFHAEKGTELQQALDQLEEERRRSEELRERLAGAQEQMNDEYRRGEESARQEAARLEEELNRVRAERAALQAQLEAARPAFEEARSVRQALADSRSFSRMPRSNEDVVSYFRRIFADRLDFTERGAASAAKCGINPEVLWQTLYAMATVLVDMHRSAAQDVEEAFKQQTGLELALHEGKQTRAQTELMNLRKDTYQGREISIEPHIKFPRSQRKTGAQWQRLYYAYDPQSRRVIVGFVGDHLTNHSTLSFH